MGLALGWAEAVRMLAAAARSADPGVDAILTTGGTGLTETEIRNALFYLRGMSDRELAALELGLDLELE